MASSFFKLPSGRRKTNWLLGAVAGLVLMIGVGTGRAHALVDLGRLTTACPIKAPRRVFRSWSIPRRCRPCHQRGGTTASSISARQMESLAPTTRCSDPVICSIGTLCSSPTHRRRVPLNGKTPMLCRCPLNFIGSKLDPHLRKPDRPGWPKLGRLATIFRLESKQWFRPPIVVPSRVARKLRRPPLSAPRPLGLGRWWRHESGPARPAA